MLFQHLLGNLEKDYHFEYAGSVQEEIYMMQKVNSLPDNLMENILYIANANIADTSWRTRGRCILIPDRLESAEAISRSVQHILLNDLRKHFLSDSHKNVENRVEKILKNLLERKGNYPGEEKKALESLGWQEFDKYYILAIRKKETLSEKQFRSELYKFLKEDIYDLQDYYVLILHSEKYTEYTEQNFLKLSKYLKKQKMLAVLSMGFTDILTCSSRYTQCKECIEWFSEEMGSGLYYYGRFQMKHMLKCLNQEHRYDLRNFCLPIVLQLYEIDKKENTEYLSTLFTYICSGQAVKHSADAMHIHVNTMYMRINKLKDDFKIDFNDMHMVYTLHNSIVFLHIYDDTCLKNSYPYLKNYREPISS